MVNAMDQFQRFMVKYGFIETERIELSHLCNIVTFKKGKILMNEGKQQNHIYFICKGIVRSYILNKDGEAKTYGFRIENMLSTGYSNYNHLDDYKAKYSIECLEDCIMIEIPTTAIEFMINNSANGERVGRFLAEYHVMDLVNFIIDLETKTLIERYYNLNKYIPDILQRVPQHMIASYLGTTAENLSRVKNLQKNSKRFD